MDKSKTITLRIDPPTLAKLRELAKHYGTSMATIVRNCISAEWNSLFSK